MLVPLNIPENSFIFRNNKGKEQIFDRFRKKYINLTPEEWVRQNFLCWLCDTKKFPASLMAVEKSIEVNHLKRRYDAVIYDKSHNPVMLIEFKSPNIKIMQAAFEQAARYNLKLKVPYLIVSNGMNHFCCCINFENGEISFLKEIPEFSTLKF